MKKKKKKKNSVCDNVVLLATVSTCALNSYVCVDRYHCTYECCDHMLSPEELNRTVEDERISADSNPNGLYRKSVCTELSELNTAATADAHFQMFVATHQYDYVGMRNILANITTTMMRLKYKEIDGYTMWNSPINHIQATIGARYESICEKWIPKLSELVKLRLDRFVANVDSGSSNFPEEYILSAVNLINMTSDELTSLVEQAVDELTNKYQEVSDDIIKLAVSLQPIAKRECICEFLTP